MNVDPSESNTIYSKYSTSRKGIWHILSFEKYVNIPLKIRMIDEAKKG